MSHTKFFIFSIKSAVLVSMAFSEGSLANCVGGRCPIVSAAPSSSHGEVAPPAPHDEAAPERPVEEDRRREVKPVEKTFSKTFEELLEVTKQPLAMTLDAADKPENNQKFSVGGSNHEIQNVLNSIKAYREKLSTCQGDEATAKLAILIDDFMASLLESFKSEATADSGNVTEGFSGFIKNILNPNKSHHLSEKKLNTFILQIKKYLADKSKKFDSVKDTFKAEDAKFEKAVDDLSQILTNNKFRKDIFDEEMAKEDTSTSKIVEDTNKAIESFTDKTCKLVEEKPVAAASATPPTTEDSSSEEEEREEEEKPKVSRAEDFNEREERVQDPEKKEEPKKPTENRVADTFPDKMFNPSPPVTTAPDFSAAKNDEELENLKDALDEIKKAFAALAGMEKDRDSLIQKKEDPKSDSDSVIASLLSGLGGESKKGNVTPSSSSAQTPAQASTNDKKEKLNIEAPPAIPQKAENNVQLPMFPPSSSQNTNSSFSDSSKFSIEDSRPTNNYVPRAQSAETMAALELAKINLQMAQQRQQAAPVMKNVGFGSGFSGNRRNSHPEGFKTPGGTPTRTKPPKVK